MTGRPSPRPGTTLRVLAVVAAESLGDIGAAGTGGARSQRSATLQPAHVAVVTALDSTADGRSLRSSMGANYDAILMALDSPEHGLGRQLRRWHSVMSGAPAVVDVLAVEVLPVSTEWSDPTLTPGRLVVVLGSTSEVPDQSGPWQQVFVVEDRSGIHSLQRPPVPHAIARWLGLLPPQSTNAVWLGDRDPSQPEPSSGPARRGGVRSAPARESWPPPGEIGAPGPSRSGSVPIASSPPAPAPGGASLAAVAQHMMAQTVSALAPRTEAAVTVTISGTELMPSSSNAGMAEFMADPSRVLTVFARSRGPIEIVDGWRHELPVQPAGASARCQFVIRAVAPGIGSVVVSVFQGSDDLASVELPLTVQAGVPIVDRESLQTRGARVTASGPPRLRNQLRVYKDGPEGYTCELTMPSVGLELRQRIRPQGGTPERLRAVLESVGRLSALSLHHGPALDDHLLGLGRRIQQWFLPSDFVSHLWEQRSQVDRLEVLSDEPHLPWELCAVSSPSGDIPEARPFLGERGVTRRWPNLVGVRSLSVDRNRCFLIAPTYPGMPDRFLARGAGEAELVETRFGARRVPADLASVSELIRSGDYDLLHFVGHGWSSFGPVDESRLILDDSEYVDEQTPTGFTSQMVRKSDRHPIVFLNGCETGRVSTCMGGFAVAFMGAGAGLFIGTHWEVEDGPAREFAEALYECLFDQALTLSESMAVVRARRGPVWTATPLAYAAYGDPDAKVVAK